MKAILGRASERIGTHPVLLAALGLATLFHGTLLATGSFRRTYDAYVHIFFADHYARGWFETWEPRWYTGFTVTSYPPGTHQLVALLSRFLGLEGAFVLVQLAGVLLVVTGVYRLTLLIADRRSAGLAALLAVLATGVAEAVHVFGQLPTICALGLLLNSLPAVRRWVVKGDRRDLVVAVALLAGTTALHHVTTLFGTVFFLGPVMADGLLERFRTPVPGESEARPQRVGLRTIVPLAARRLRRVVRPVTRAGVLGGLVLVALVVVVFPYWVWSRTDPIVQIPIPHGSRENFLTDLNAGLVFWVVPWGPMLLALPFALWRGIRSAAWPYVLSLGLLTLLGTGGTTPIPRLLLGGAFDILTLDRFTFWATVLVLPFAGMLATALIDGTLAQRIVRLFGGPALRLLQAGLIAAVLASAIFTVGLTHSRQMQPDAIDPEPIVAFLEKDQHWQWRYLTLGFGDQMAWLTAQTEALTVDGNYHSARRLPELVTTPVERLEGAKFRGVPGIGSLQQFLAVPEKYHLKFVFSNDQFYDPLLYFSGWRTLGRLENGIVVWEREDVPPMPAIVDQPELPGVYRLMWGTLPLLALAFAAGAAAASAVTPQRPSPRPVRRRRFPLARLEAALETTAHRLVAAPGADRSWKAPLHRVLGRLHPGDRTLRLIVVGVTALAMAVTAVGAVRRSSPGPGDVVVSFYDDLDFRRFERAWNRLDPTTRPALSEYLVALSVEDGLLASYASLDAAEIGAVSIEGDRAYVDVNLSYVTSLAEYPVLERVALRRHEGEWHIEWASTEPDEPVERLARRTSVAFEPMGRRTVTAATTEYDDVLDRPELDVSNSRVVLFDGRPVAIGEVRNVDADPAALTVTTQLLGDQGEVAAVYNAAQVIQHSLLPGESTPYRVDFEAVAERGESGSFRPDEFVPIDPVPDIAGLDVYAAAVVTGRGLDRPVVLRDLTVDLDTAAVPRLSGSILNLGTDDATVTALLVSLYDLEGRLLWVDRVVVPQAVRPGLERPFTADLTARSRLEPQATEVRPFANGLPLLPPSPTPAVDRMPLPTESGYSALAVQAITFARSTS